MIPLELIGESSPIIAVRDRLHALVTRYSGVRRLPPILIEGETGTGKGLVARLLHMGCSRAHGPFVDLNCAEIPETLVEAELFGHERGAFTDAREAKPGLFRTAHGGTMFLDEIGLLPITVQPKLLKAIEDGVVRRLGSPRSDPVDVWILSATNEDLDRAMTERRFRQDLYHRLAVLTLRLPPLRDRDRDIVLLAEHFLAAASADYGLGAKTLTPEASAVLLAYPWPGNVRELRNVMERVVLVSDGARVAPEHLGLGERAEPPGLRTRATRSSLDAPPEPPSDPEHERRRLAEALSESRWNISQAAARLGISRNTLRHRIAKHGLSPDPDATSGHVASRSPSEVSSPPSAPPPSSDLRWELRRVALVAAVLDAPEADAPHERRRALDDLVDKIHTFGGRVEDLTQVSVTAAFGLDSVDDPFFRAAIASMAMEKTAKYARRGQTTGFVVRIALVALQGAVAATPQRVELDANAKRDAQVALQALLHHAAPNSILVDPVAKTLLERRFELTDAGPSAAAYRLAGRHAALFRRGAVMASLVGRESELTFLDRLCRAVGTGHGHGVGIVGDVGIGKSRLVFEFKETLRTGQWTLLESRCVPYSSCVPYWPLADIIGQLCGFVESDHSSELLPKVHRTLAAWDIPARRADDLAFLLGLRDGSPLSPEGLRDAAFDVLLRVLLRMSQRQPIVFVIEDLHWADTGSERFFAQLMGALPRLPVLFVATYRPGYQPSWSDRSYFTQISLTPLSPGDSLAMLRASGAASVVESPFLDRIMDRAGGNPFFLEELSRAVDTDPAHSGAPLPLPATVQEAIGTRISQLGEGPRRTLQVSAVVGRTVPLPLLQAVCDRPEEVGHDLLELTRREFLHASPTTDETTYAFRHALTQEVAYQTLVPEERAELHRAIANGLRQLYGNRLGVTEILAYHYSKASPSENGADHLIAFAARAARGASPSQALAALDKASEDLTRLMCEPTGGRTLRVVAVAVSRAEALHALGDFGRVETTLTEQVDRVSTLPGSPLVARFHFLTARTSSHLGRRRPAAEALQRALDVAELVEDRGTAGRVSCGRVFEDFWLGRFGRLDEHLRRAQQLLTDEGHAACLGHGHVVLGLSYVLRGVLDRASEAFEIAERLAEGRADRRLTLMARSARVFAELYTPGDTAADQGDLQALLEASGGDDGGVRLAVLGYAHTRRGEGREAVDCLERARLTARARPFEVVIGAWLADAYDRAGRARDAEAMASETSAVAAEALHPLGTAWSHRTLARVRQARGDLKGALDHLDVARQALAATDAILERARCLQHLAEVANALGAPDSALRSLRAAKDLLDGHGAGLDRERDRLARAALDLGLDL